MPSISFRGDIRTIHELTQRSMRCRQLEKFCTTEITWARLDSHTSRISCWPVRGSSLPIINYNLLLYWLTQLYASSQNVPIRRTDPIARPDSVWCVLDRYGPPAINVYMYIHYFILLIKLRIIIAHIFVEDEWAVLGRLCYNINGLRTATIGPRKHDRHYPGEYFSLQMKHTLLSHLASNSDGVGQILLVNVNGLFVLLMMLPSHLGVETSFWHLKEKSEAVFKHIVPNNWPIDGRLFMHMV